MSALDFLKGEREYRENDPSVSFNVTPKIDVFTEPGYTHEEFKIIIETKKRLHVSSLQVAPTCARVPVFTSHAESVYIEIDSNKQTVDDITRVLRDVACVIVQDDPKTNLYPTPVSAGHKDDVLWMNTQDPNLPNGFICGL